MSIDDRLLQTIVKDPESYVDVSTKDFLTDIIRRATREDIRPGIRNLAEELYIHLDLHSCGFHINGIANVNVEIDPTTGNIVDELITPLETVETPTLSHTEKMSRITCPLYYKDKPTTGYAFFDKQELSEKDIATIMSAIKRLSSPLNIMLSAAHWKKKALEDELTGTYTRTMIAENSQQLITEPLKRGEALSVILLDIDRFKEINDTYGHVYGDHVLRTVAKKIQETVRPEDIVVRWGGDEFIVLARATGEFAQDMASRIEEVIEDTDFTESSQLSEAEASRGYYSGRTAHEVMVSTGVESINSTEKRGQALDIINAICEGADRKMYEDKRGKRLQSVFTTVSRNEILYEGLILRWNRRGGAFSVIAYDATNFKQAIAELGERKAWQLFADLTNRLEPELAGADWTARQDASDRLYATFSSSEPIMTVKDQLCRIGKRSLDLLNNTPSDIAPDFNLQFSVGIAIYHKKTVNRRTRLRLLKNPSETRNIARMLTKHAAETPGLMLVDIYNP